MKPKNTLKPAFFKTVSCLTLGILTITNTSQLVVAEIGSSAVTRQHTLAQFSGSDSQSQERSQLVQTANTLFSQGDLTGAEENLRKLIKKYPKDAFGHYQLGNVLFRQDKKEDAIKAYQEAIRIDSKYALAHNAIGIVFADQERWEEAIVEYNKALAINPNYGDALTNLAQALWIQGKRNEAIASLEKALNIFKEQNRPQKVERIEKILREMKTGDDPTVS
ncbi:MAG: tetratricopeptide repeat protein [Fischerella sp.]|jgi:tetratricopeptide (TPR) repeat protein|uniref:tetratricopeptide repeat protein n=1 Tax=unclassified Fischerella TaxID=494603 RepID=UPI00047D7379|nr:MULTISPECIES: tetratricopeptide repeat protein [unclassified Fischerella]NWF59097.1 tetratricopeptide repeat protein [Fischerella sp.]